MTLKYVPPTQMAEYRQAILLFAKGAKALKCVSSHFLPDRTGLCDLTKTKDHDEVFVLANRAGATLKVSKFGMQLVANVVDIEEADQWYEHLKEQRRADKDRQAQDLERREAARNAPKAVIFKKKPTELLGKNKP
jgi:hypothetical protein